MYNNDYYKYYINYNNAANNYYVANDYDNKYYNNNIDGFSEEAEWCFGLSWLAIIYTELGDKEKAYYYLRRAKRTVTAEGKVPELYYSNTDKPNDNTPLGWAESMYVIALHKVKNSQ